MSGMEIFFWGAAGGTIFELLQIRDALIFRAGQGRDDPLPLVGLCLIAILFSAAGGLLAFLLVGPEAGVRPMAVLLVGFGGTATFPLISRPSNTGANVPGRGPEKSPSREAFTHPAGYKGVLAWWTADRIRTLLMAGMFIVALLTYIKH